MQEVPWRSVPHRQAMAFCVGNLVVSVSGCSLDKQDGPLVDPCVELSVGNKLHSTSLPVELSSDDRKDGRRSRGDENTGSTPVAFHGVTEEDALTVTVFDRASPSKNGREGFVAEAEPLLCTDWGLGGRAVQRTCVIAAPEEVSRRAGAVGAPIAATGAWCTGGELRGRSTVQLSICWSPKVRLRKPLSMVAKAGKRTSTMLSSKIDRPVSAVLNFILDAAAHVNAVGPGWKSAAVGASLASVSVGSVFSVAIAAFFLPVTLALAAAAAMLALPAAALGWVIACTSAACDHLWRPLLVWAATRSATAKRLLLLPWEGGNGGLAMEEDVAGGRQGAGGDGHGVGNSGGWEDRQPVSVGVPRRGEGGGGPDVIGSATAGVVLLLACYQNLLGILNTGLTASRWRPRPR